LTAVQLLLMIFYSFVL